MFQPSNFLSMSNKAYDIIKWVVTILAPAFIVLYTTLAQVWGWSNSDRVTLTVGAITLFLGTLIKLSSTRYGKEVDALFQEGPGGGI